MTPAAAPTVFVVDDDDIGIVVVGLLLGLGDRHGGVDLCDIGQIGEAAVDPVLDMVGLHQGWHFAADCCFARKSSARRCGSPLGWVDVNH